MKISRHSQPMNTRLHFVKQHLRCAPTSRCAYGKRSSIPMKKRSVQMHQKNKDANFYDLNVSELKVILREVRLYQMFNDDYSKKYDSVVNTIRERISVLNEIEMNKYINDYAYYLNELKMSLENEKKNFEKERFYSKFSTWESSNPVVDMFTCDDKLVEVQVQLHESIERCRDFENRERIFKEKTFGKRLASRIDF